MHRRISFLLLNIFFVVVVIAQRKMEYLNRGVFAVNEGNGKIFVSWRLLVTDEDNATFNVYRTDNNKTIKINQQPIADVTGITDNPAEINSINTYTVKKIINNKEVEETGNGFSIRGDAKPYLAIPLKTPPGYTPNDISVGDVDGDGEYEIILHQTGRSKDNSQAGFTDPPIFQCYKLNGTLLWQINLGKNIREGAHYTQLMVYDLDGDGKAEVVMKTADGTVDGKGNVIGDSTKDWRNANGYILSGPEYLTVFSGLTGEALYTTNYIVPRHPETENPTFEQLKQEWGDGYGNRVDRFLACVAYLDGIHPSVIMCRGYYTRTTLAAWDWDGKKLSLRWLFDTDKGDKKFAGQGNHNLSVADVDGDGKDEIIYGQMTVDDNGKGLYSIGIGHADALHVGDLDPEHPGLEVFSTQERFDDAGMNFRDAKTGEVIWKVASVTPDKGNQGPGRALSLDIDPRYEGYECWTAGGGIIGLYDCKGNKICDKTPPCNMGIFWDGDDLSEILNGTFVGKWDYINSTMQKLFDAKDFNCVSNNGTKLNPCLVADLFGDWREELIYRTADNSELRIFSTSIPTKRKLFTLMQDPQYRLSIVWQNVAYNQPPHTSFYFGYGMKQPDKPNVEIIRMK